MLPEADLRLTVLLVPRLISLFGAGGRGEEEFLKDCEVTLPTLCSERGFNCLNLGLLG